MIEITKVCIFAPMKARISLVVVVVRCREREKKTEDGGNLLFKALANRIG